MLSVGDVFQDAYHSFMPSVSTLTPFSLQIISNAHNAADAAAAPNASTSLVLICVLPGRQPVHACSCLAQFLAIHVRSRAV